MNKRKASNATPSSGEGAPKKIKLLNSHAPSPAAASSGESQVQKVGFRLVEQLKKGTDKTGRHIATQFLTLPSRSELPHYYQEIKLPLAIDDIERKLGDNVYATITQVESDFKRMVQNAKDYNTTGSEVFEDAERIRKLVYNYMKINNPEYSTNPNYTSFPTPIPQNADGAANGNAVNGRKSATPAQPRKSTAPASSEPPDRKASVAPSATTGDAGDWAENASGVDFTGKTLQQAQQMIIRELLEYTDEEGLEIYTPFANLPTRKLEDYYKFIQHPVSLKKVAKQTQGIHGRHEVTGNTDFKTWDAFEEEVSFIWRNARDYNEDGSDMYLLANEFEEHFKSLLEDARSKVEEPSGPRLKLGGPKPKVTLNLSQQHRPSPTPNAVSVDNDALARQKQMVNAGVNGRQTDQRPSPAVNGHRSSSQVPTLDAGAHPQSSSLNAQPGAVKSEKTTTASPALNAAIPAATTNGAMMPPPVRPPSSSPYPNGQPGPSSYHFTAPALLPPTPVRTYAFEDALLPAVTIASHPHLKLANPFNLTIPPHSTLTQQSRTLTLPSTHYYLQISPTISKSLSAGRAYKMFVTVNGVRLTQRDTVMRPEDGLRTHVYEGTLAPGVNRVEVEVAAAKEGAKEGLDVEKLVVFANLMKGS